VTNAERRGPNRIPFHPDNTPPGGYSFPMSAAEIIEELPRLTEVERRAVRQRLSELAAESEDIALCNQAALEGAIVLDRMEEEDAASSIAVKSG